jgi:hypothetical protein
MLSNSLQLNGYCHDSAGNLVLNSTCPTGTFSPTYSYDVENRLASTAGWKYTYDGDGPAGHEVQWQRLYAVLGRNRKRSAGREQWEEPLARNTPFFDDKRVARRDLPGGAVSYYFADHLGSASVITNSPLDRFRKNQIITRSERKSQ